MKRKVVLVAGGNPDNWPDITDWREDAQTVWVGIDRGALYLLERGIQPEMAIGDFDSLTSSELAQVNQKIAHIYQSIPEKDDTDTQLALLKAAEKYPEASFLLIGATGGRMDHFLSNLWLPLEPRFARILSKMKLIDRQNTLTYFSAGHFTIKKEADKKYLAFVCLTPVTNFSILDAKYTLKNEQVNYPVSYASNEFVGKTVTFSFGSGTIVVIQSKDQVQRGTRDRI